MSYPISMVSQISFVPADDRDSIFIANRDAGWSISTHVLLAAHMIFVNILLTNLLIAMFRYVIV